MTTINEEGLGIRILPGAGERILWIHGYTLNSTVWRDLWQKLPGYTHVGVDLPGHGVSRPLNHYDSLARLASSLARVAREHDIRNLVGMSFGGMVALQLAMEHPFASLVLASPALAGGPEDKHAQTRNLKLMCAFRDSCQREALRKIWMRSPPDIFKGASKHPILWERLAGIIDQHSWNELNGGEGMMAFTRTPQTAFDLRQISAATLILVGDDDMSAFKRTAELIRRNVRRCETMYVENAGHLSLLESSDMVLPSLLNHWKSHAAVCRQR